MVFFDSYVNVYQRIWFVQGGAPYVVNAKVQITQMTSVDERGSKLVCK